jgi:hypothetical protein
LPQTRNEAIRKITPIIRYEGTTKPSAGDHETGCVLFADTAAGILRVRFVVRMLLFPVGLRGEGLTLQVAPGGKLVHPKEMFPE